MPDKPVIAIFDLDRTITRSGTYTPFLLGWAIRHAPWRLLAAPLVIALMLGYLLKRVGRDTVKVAMLRLLMGSPGRSAVDARASAFARAIMPQGCNAEALAEIARLKRQGATLAMATASFDWCAEAIGRELGFSAVIATRSAWTADGRLRPVLEGANCYGAEKLRRLEAEFATAFGLPREAAQVLFYTDHQSDLPCLDWADEGIAVRPNVKLRRLMQQRSFRLLPPEPA